MASCHFPAVEPLFGERLNSRLTWRAIYQCLHVSLKRFVARIISKSMLKRVFQAAQVKIIAEPHKSYDHASFGVGACPCNQGGCVRGRSQRRGLRGVGGALLIRDMKASYDCIVTAQEAAWYAVSQCLQVGASAWRVAFGATSEENIQCRRLQELLMQ